MKNYLKPTENFTAAIEAALDSLPDGEARRSRPAGKIAVVCAAAALALAIGVGASSVARWQNSWSSAEADFSEMPSQKELEERFGYPYKAVEEFHNGFKFSGGYIEHNEQYGDEEEFLGEYESFACEYEKGGSYVSFITRRAVDKEIEGEIAESYKGLDIYYTASTFFLVPDSYSITDEDEAALKRGEYSFSFADYYPTEEEKAEISSGDSQAAFSLIGSENQSPAIKHQKSVEWVDGGTVYWIGYVGAENMSRDELVGMAKEIIG